MGLGLRKFQGEITIGGYNLDLFQNFEPSGYLQSSDSSTWATTLNLIVYDDEIIYQGTDPSDI